MYVLGLCSAILGIVMATLVAGGVVGQEFCADSFEIRDFKYHQIPLIRVQVTSSRRSLAAPLRITEGLLVQKWLRLRPASRWDLVGGTIGSVEAPPGDAAILLAYTESTDAQGELLWQEWSNDHPQAASQLWPLVADAARQGAYAALPAMFDAAKEFADRPPAEIALRLKAVLANELQAFAEGLQLQGLAAEAQAVADYASSLDEEVGGRF